MEEIKLVIYGNPVPWMAHGGKGKRSFNPRWREKEYFQSKIRDQYKGIVHTCPLEASYSFYIAIPKSVSKKKKVDMLQGIVRPTKRPDRDNYAKFLSDVMQGIVYEDDAQIVDGSVSKWYCDTPRTVIRLKTL